MASTNKYTLINPVVSHSRAAMLTWLQRKFSSENMNGWLQEVKLRE
jgi:hypothetical protein